MSALEKKMQLSRSKIQEWLSKKIGKTPATIDDLDGANRAIEEFLKERGLGNLRMIQVLAGDARHFVVQARGEGQNFHAACRLVNAHFGTGLN